MARYIDADRLLKEIEDCPNKPEINDGAEEAEWIIKCINSTPAADVRSVTHGYWKPIFDTETDKERGFAMEYECSECGCISRDCTYSHGLDYEFCPCCGAKMDGEDV